MTSSTASEPDTPDEFRDDGLDDAEGEVMDALVEAFDCYLELPVQHPDESSEFRYHIHMLQGLLACRVARRDHPRGWHSGDHPPHGDVQGDQEAVTLEAEEDTAEDPCERQDDGESSEVDAPLEGQEAAAQGDREAQDADRRERRV